MRRAYPLDRATAERIATRRRAARLTQNDVALQVGVSESTIAKVESLRVPLSPELRAGIERALDEAERRQEAGTAR